MGLRVFRANIPPTVDDVRELKAFLESRSAADEKSLQYLLERHPSLIGILGFSDFLSEPPLYKTNADNAPDITDLRRRDRADLIAAKTSPVLSSYRSANIIELKGATRHIGDRSVGFRLSVEANVAVEQLHEYRSWLTTIPQNKALLNSLQWDVRWPTLSLIMGRASEFSNNPGQFEEIKSRLIGREVHLYTIDDMLELAMRHVEQRIVPPNVVELVGAPADVSFLGPYLAGVVINRLQEALQVAAQNPRSLASMPPRAFVELVAEVYRRSFGTFFFHHDIDPDPTTNDGIDIAATLALPGPGLVRVAIQCKSVALDRAIEVEDVREFEGVRSDADIPRAYFVTTGRFSPAAIDFAASKVGLQLVDLDRLTEIIRKEL